MRQQLTTEVTGSYERELKSNLAVRGLYVLKSDAWQYANTNILRPYSAYNIPINRRDPGLDGGGNGSETVWARAGGGGSVEADGLGK